MKMMMKALLVLLLAAFGSRAFAEPGERTYAVELASGGGPRAAEILRDLADAHGAVVVSGDASRDRLLIRTTEPRAIAITADPRVRGLIPIDTFAPEQPVNRPFAVASSAITWGTGVAYQYDGAGNIKKIGSDSFVYDQAGRLVQSDTDAIRRNFTYDAFGNRTNCIQAQGTSVESNCQGGWTVASANNRISGATYDAAGNVTHFRGHTYSYDALNMLTRDASPFAVREFIYAPGGERIAVHTVGESWRWTVRDSSGKVLREFVSDATGTGGWQWTKDYIWRDGLLLATRQPEPDSTTPTTYHYHLDHLGTPRRITNATDTIVGVHEYHPFGPELSGGINEPSLTALKYTGHERDLVPYDPVSLDYMHARYYDPELGRFLSVDPGNDWNPAKPQSWNMYAYVRNNPVNATDPNGKNVVLLIRIGRLVLPPIGRYAVRSALRVAGPTFVQASTDYYRQRTSNYGHPVVVPPALSQSEAPTVSWPGWDSTAPPDSFTDWRGKAGAAPGTNAVGAWVNPDTGEYWSPDLEHDAPKGPHWTFGDAEGNKWDVYPDGTVVPSGEDKPEPAQELDPKKKV